MNEIAVGLGCTGSVFMLLALILAFASDSGRTHAEDARIKRLGWASLCTGSGLIIAMIWVEVLLG